jgi:hypothetical protein
LVTIERGGHPFLGHDAEVRNEISAFVASAVNRGRDMPQPAADGEVWLQLAR